MFKEQIIEAARKNYEKIADNVIEKVIPIPRIHIQQGAPIEAGFSDFDVDTRALNYQPVSEEIVRRTLRTNESESIHHADNGSILRDTPENIIINELINFSEVDYDRDANLLHKLAGQVLDVLGRDKTEDELRNIVVYHKSDIGKYIHAQLRQHFFLKTSGFEVVKVFPFSKIEQHNFAMYLQDKIHHYAETITPTQAIPSKIFGGFSKACHSLYKFDSKAEKDFATILEGDNQVLRWLRPAQSQFSIYWNHNSQRYVPDFVVETSDTIYMVEIKAENQIDNAEVREKAEAAEKFCATASSFNAENRGKKWSYLLIAHSDVTFDKSFENFR